MTPFDTVRATALPLGLANCDTDQIVPARFLSRRRDQGFGEQLFHDLRYADGHPRADFPLNQAAHRAAGILLAGANFGCGSSRESAVWALVDAGLRVVVAPSFGDIFFGNATKNGLLPIVQPAAQVDAWLAAVRQHPPTVFEVDLAAQELRCAGKAPRHFDIDPLRKHMLLSGLDEIALTLAEAPALDAFEQGYERHAPWLAAPAATGTAP
ncbi:3-isopropylmalate dehydratase small subunit [Pseudorhodoferax sp.]|uniref:3-isopropylmalate dehydratase small subunit n=1 Tax=Pseudorhodoferax sp. TaxID=1993553 RepID=UPI002DD6A31F|nr:3-isopropylmalate dehydratase small subunit [Pseudorhodoferax sp.]